MTSISWRTGANSRELAFFGAQGDLTAKKVIELGESAWIGQQLDSLQGIGVQVVRFYAAHQWFSAAATIPLIKNTLDQIGARHMQAIVCLNDSIGERLFNVKGDEAFHTETNLGHLRSDYWSQTLKPYNKFYIPYITKIVRAFKSHPAVMMWELGNEYGIYPDPANANQVKGFLTFADIASSTIKSISPNKLVSTGLINTHHIESSGGDVAAFSNKLHRLHTIDAISLHDYREFNGAQDGNFNIDVTVAKGLGKPFYVGEFGGDINAGGRGQFYRDKIKVWKDAGASIVAFWAYDDVARPNPAVTDVGIADRNGVSKAHSDFDELRGIVSGFRGGAPMLMAAPGFQPQPPAKKKRKSKKAA